MTWSSSSVPAAPTVLDGVSHKYHAVAVHNTCARLFGRKPQSRPVRGISIRLKHTAKILKEREGGLVTSDQLEIEHLRWSPSEGKIHSQASQAAPGEAE